MLFFPIGNFKLLKEIPRIFLACGQVRGIKRFRFRFGRGLGLCFLVWIVQIVHERSLSLWGRLVGNHRSFLLNGHLIA